MSWRTATGRPNSPEIVIESSSEDEANKSTLPLHGNDEGDVDRIDASVEEVRANSPAQGSARHLDDTDLVKDKDDTEESPLFNKRTKAKVGRPIFSDSSDDEDGPSPSVAAAIDRSLHDITGQFETFSSNLIAFTSTPMPHVPKKFTFKNKQSNADAVPRPPILEEEGGYDLSASLQLLEIEDVGASKSKGQEANKVSETQKRSQHDISSNTTLELGDSDSDKETPPGTPEVILPKRVEPPKPQQSRPLKTIYLNELPERSAAGAGAITATVFVPTSAHNQVDRALTLLSKTIELIPAPEEEAPTPDGFKVKLYPHQAYGLQWLWWREHHFPGGGILADEMGLGKTVMIMALVMKSLAEGSPTFDKKKESEWQTNEKKRVPSQCTLIVVPPSVIGQWELEIKQKASGLRFYVFHGPNREKSAKMLSRYDIVLTTYSTMSSEIPKGEQDERHYIGSSPLVNIQFDRIVLDEGHTIRNEKTNIAFAACQINANHRWIVTGTPIHNRPADMHSLVKFIRLTPFDDAKLWDHWIGLKKLSETNNSQARLNIIGRALVLRRTKSEVSAIGPGCPSIPPKTLEDIPLTFSQGEQQIYDHLYEYASSVLKKFFEQRDQNQLNADKQRAADKYIANGRKPGRTDEVSFTTAFTFLLRLRQCCVLPYLIHDMVADDDLDPDVDLNSSQLPEDDEIISLRNPVFAPDFTSVKIERLILDLQTIREEARDSKRPMDKVVVVSQWTSFLKILKGHLKEAGYRTCEITGEVKIAERAGVMMRFNSAKPTPEIMLLSLTAGGVGLNLTGANHMFFMDLHWNPQLELQCQDRVHRFGQKKPVTIHRYITEGTLEQRVLELQKGKLELANDLLQNKRVGTGLTIQEMRNLFNI